MDIRARVVANRFQTHRDYVLRVEGWWGAARSDVQRGKNGLRCEMQVFRVEDMEISRRNDLMEAEIDPEVCI